MTIKEVATYYFKHYDKLNICTEMFNGMSGKTKTFTEKEYYEYMSGWLEEEVIKVYFSTYSTCYFKGNYEKTKKEIPNLTIIYNNEEN